MYLVNVDRNGMAVHVDWSDCAGSDVADGSKGVLWGGMKGWECWG
jgi:hypothetical protein